MSADADPDDVIEAKKQNDDFTTTFTYEGHGFEIMARAEGNEYRADRAGVIVSATIREYLRSSSRFIPGGTHGKKAAVDACFESGDTTLDVVFTYSINGDHDADVAADVFDLVDAKLTDRKGDTVSLHGVTVDMPHDWRRVQA